MNVPSVVRTLTPIVVGWLLSIAAQRGLNIDPTVGASLLTPVLSGVYYVAARWLETHVSQRFGWLLGQPGAPTYTAPAGPSAPTPDPVEPAGA